MRKITRSTSFNQSSLLLASLLLNAVFCNAQTTAHSNLKEKNKIATSIQSIPTEQISQSAQRQLQSKFSQYQLFEVSLPELNAELRSSSGMKTLSLFQNSTEPVIMNIVAKDIRSDNYILRTSTPAGIIELPRSPCSTYEGYLTNNPNEKVYLFINENSFSAAYTTNGERHFIEQVNHFSNESTASILVEYSSENMIVKPDGLTCLGFEIESELSEKSHSAKIAMAPDSSCKLTEIAIAATSDMYTERGNSVTAVENHAITNLNIVRGFYHHSPINIQYTITEIFVSQIVGEIVTTSNGLYDFRTWGNSGGFKNKFDVASCWTNKSFGAQGMAWLRTICGTYRYNINLDLTGLGTTSTIQAHELGHNWGATHTNNLMTTNVNAAATGFSNTNITEILNFKSLVTCTDQVSTCGTGTLPNTNYTLKDTALCLGEELIVTNLPAIIDTPATFYWDFGNGIISKVKNPTSITYTKPGTYSIWHKIVNKYGVSTNTRKVTVSDQCNLGKPGVSFTTARFFCTGSSVTLDAGSGYPTYLWSNGKTDRNITVSTGGNYWVRTTTINGGSLLSDTVKVNEYDCHKPDKIIANLNLNEGTGALAADNSGFNNFGTLTSGPWFDDNCRKGVMFEKTGNCINMKDFYYGDDFTLMLWFNKSNLQSGATSQYLYSHGLFAKPNSLSIYYSTTNSDIITYLSAYNDLYWTKKDISTTTIAHDKWHLYTLSMKRDNNFTVYIDGKQKFSATTSTGGLDPSGDISLGCSATKYDLRGKLDQVTFYNYNFTSTMVSDYYNANAKKCDSIPVVTSTINHTPENLSVSCYPNPTNEKFQLNIQLEKPEQVRLRITTILGQEIYSRSISATTLYNESVSSAGWQAGLYFLQVDGASEHRVLRLMKSE